MLPGSCPFNFLQTVDLTASPNQSLGLVPRHAYTQAETVEDAWERGFIKQDSMESDPITFAGYGDPLLRLSTVEAAATAIKHRRHGAQLRLMTNGEWRRPTKIM